MKRLALVVLVACSSKKTEVPPVPAVPPAPAAKVVAATRPIERPVLPDGPVVSAKLGAAGGALTSSDGLLAITVPPGVVATDTTFSVQEIGVNTPGSPTGRGYRLEPHGPFGKPISLAFKPEPGRSLDGAAVATKIASGWSAPAQVHVGDTIQVRTDHLSDWSITSGIALTPAQASTSKRGTVGLGVQICFTPAPTGTLDPTPVICQLPTGVGNMLRSARLLVNGVANGDASVGTLEVTGDATLRYTAPAQVPAANPVAISVEFTTLPNERFGRIVGVASIFVVDEPSYFGFFTSVTKHAEGETRSHGTVFWNYDASDRTYHATGVEHVDIVLGCGVASGGAQKIDPSHSVLELGGGSYNARIAGLTVTSTPCQDTAVEGEIAGTGGLDVEGQRATGDDLFGTFTTADPDFPTTYTWKFWKF